MTYATAQTLLPLTVAIPLLTGALLAPFSKVLPRAVTVGLSAGASLAVLGISLRLMFYAAGHGDVLHWMGGWVPLHGIAIGIDFQAGALNAALAAFISLLVFLAGMYTWTKFDLVGTLFHSLLMTFMAAMVGFALTGDIFNMFVWFELMSAAAIALTAHKIEEAESIEGAINLAVTNTIAGFVVLLGIALLYGRTGALNMAQIGNALHGHAPDTLVVVAFLLIVCGYFVKGAVAPFYFWLDDAHAVAPTPICLLFSGIMVQVALYGVARIYWSCFAGTLGPHEAALRGLFVGLGLATAVAGSLMTYAQPHLKRMLAFSTVSHSGAFVAAMGLFNGPAMAALALFVLAHGLIKGMLFVCSGNYLNRFRSLDAAALANKGREVPVTTALFLFGGIALAGVPPFALFGARVLFDSSFERNGLLAALVVFSIAAAVESAAVLRSGLHIAFGWGSPKWYSRTPATEEVEVEGDHLNTTPWNMTLPALILFGLTIWVGTSESLWHGTQRAAAEFVNRTAYAGAVFGGVRQPLPHVPPEAARLPDIATSLGVLGGAILLAFAGLYRRRIPEFMRKGGLPALEWAVAQFRSLHSGIFTDYVAYIVFGLAACGVYLIALAR